MTEQLSLEIFVFIICVIDPDGLGQAAEKFIHAVLSCVNAQISVSSCDGFFGWANQFGYKATNRDGVVS